MFLSISDIIKFIIVIICILLPYMFAMDGGEIPRHRRQMTPRTRTPRTRTPRTRTPRYRGGNLINIYFIIYYKLQEYDSTKNNDKTDSVKNFENVYFFAKLCKLITSTFEK